MKSLLLKDISMNKSLKTEVKIGYEIKNIELIDKDLNFHSLYEIHGKKIISIFPSIDTGICDTQTKEMYKLAKEKNIELINVSADLPFAHKRWCLANELIDAKLLSDYNELKLGHELGIVIPEANLLYRSVFILDENNKIIYIQFAEKVGSSLDFNQIKNFLNANLINVEKTEIKIDNLAKYKKQYKSVKIDFNFICNLLIEKFENKKNFSELEKIFFNYNAHGSVVWNLFNFLNLTGDKYNHFNDENFNVIEWIDKNDYKILELISKIDILE
ncbi:thiol peroxidase [Mycoplasmoides pirum]|uniref:thiol peroxidase n=1 Tax=Mycoplasmoides pirum TaxID=2122 RepID=UPI0006971A22|nr:thiol peroxidase [Mycoplasmoides pirum]